jgi:O-antigen ligase
LGTGNLPKFQQITYFSEKMMAQAGFSMRFEWIVVIVLAALLAATPVSSRAINLAWILLFVFVLWLGVSQWRDQPKTQLSGEVSAALFVLISCFLLGFALKTGMKLYWAEPVRGVSFELNALLAAASSLILARSKSADFRTGALLGVGLAVASLLAVLQGYGYMFAGQLGPTNAVNWGAGMALFMCLAFSLAVCHKTTSTTKLMAVFSVFFLSVAILVAGRRGAMFSILWCGLAGGYFVIRDLSQQRRPALRLSALLVVMAAIVLGAWMARGQLATPLDRLLTAASEVKAIASPDTDRNQLMLGSLGSRWHMLGLGVDAAAASPWMGLGAAGRALVVERAERDVKAPLFHLHNEYLQAWVAYGVPGLVSALCFPLGLLGAGLMLRRANPGPAIAFAGLGLVHFFNGLSNVNTFHNYYGTVFAACAALPFLLCAPSRRGQPPVAG